MGLRVLLMDCIPHKTIIIGEAPAAVFQNLKEVSLNRRQNLTRDNLPLYNNSTVQKSWYAVGEVRYCDFEELNNPLYSPYLAPQRLFSVPKPEETLSLTLVFKRHWTELSHRAFRMKTKTSIRQGLLLCYKLWTGTESQR